MPSQQEKKLRGHVAFIYGEELAEQISARILERLARFQAAYPGLASSSPRDRVSERDSIMITYGDMVQQQGQPPLQSLAAFIQKYLADAVSTIHILPFFPYSSDDGFSVIDYRAVDPELGDWDDVSRLGENFRLMFDAVVNHISSQSVEFQGFLKGQPDYENFFTVVEPGTDLSRIFRPRATPVVTPYETVNGEKLVWTTFSADQIDLNYYNPDVLIEVIDILLFYASHGADFIRLDAVTYIWKEIGTDCINLPRTHRIVQLMRTVLDIVAPRVAIITETNVPHQDNIAYFGDGLNEAQMVYNFALPMLVLHAFHTGSVEKLSSWARTLELPSDQATYFNFLASHDGIGVTPVKDILTGSDIDKIIERTRKLGGNVAYKSNQDGTQNPYELNINYLDALGDPENPETDPALITGRFLASQAIMLALRGVPGIYFHSMFGSRNWVEGVEKTGRYRTINRQKMQLDTLEADLANVRSLRNRVYRGYCHLLKVRKMHPAFHPFGDQQVLALHPAIFALLRTSPHRTRHLLCLQNISDKNLSVSLDLELLPFNQVDSLLDIITQERFQISGKTLHLHLTPYDVKWLEK